MQLPPPAQLLAVLGLLLLLLRPTAVVARLVDDAALGIRRYEFRGVWGEDDTPAIVVIHLRPVCIGQLLTVRGVMGVLSVLPEADEAQHYTAPTSLVGLSWDVRLHEPATNRTRRMRIYRAVDKGDNTLSFTHLEAQLPMPDVLELRVQGSPWRHELFLPQCAAAAAGADHPLQQQPGSLLNDKHWLAVMLPRSLEVPAQHYSQLLLGHLRYHRQLGFAGSIVLCDQHQAADLLAVEAVAAASEADQLLIWPWAYEQPQQQLPYYWLLPRHQLVVLAGWGRAARVAFLDPDEFFVLPAAAPAAAAGGTADAGAAQSPLQAAKCMRLVRSQAELQEQLLKDAAARLAGGTAAAGMQQPARDAAVLRVPRFDAVLQSNCSSSSSSSQGASSGDAGCLQQHSGWYKDGGLQLQLSLCPVQPGGLRASRKPVVSPHEVVVVRLYTAAAKGRSLEGPSIPTSCGYLLHITNMVEQVRPGALLLPEAATWQLPDAATAAEAAARGRLVFAAGFDVPRRRVDDQCVGKGRGSAKPHIEAKQLNVI